MRVTAMSAHSSPRSATAWVFLAGGFVAWCGVAFGQEQPDPMRKDIGFFDRDDTRLLARRYAVVVGIGAYKSPGVSTLSFAVKDAKDIGNALADAGWKVSTLTSDQLDPRLRPDTARDIEGRILEFAAATRAGDTLLFYFSGHGFIDGEKNGYLAPISVDPTSPEQLVSSGLSIARVRAALASGKSKQQLLILDACRNEPQARSFFGVGYTEEMLRASEGLGILYATAPGNRSYEPRVGEKDLEGRPIENGLFTHFLLRGLSGDARLNGDEFLTFHELSYWVGDAMTDFVLDDAKREYAEQRPWKDWIGGMAEDVYLRAISVVADASPPTPAATSSTTAWGGIKSLGVNPNTQREEFWLPESGAEPKRRANGELDIQGSTAISFVHCPAGTFLMGGPESESGRISDENQHSVTLTQSFLMGVTEVTQRQWRDLMGTTPWRRESNVREGDAYPAVYVSWTDAMEFCSKLTERERSAGRLPSSLEITLPTEGQWEYACRAGTRTRYSFGESESALGDYAWFGTGISAANEHAQPVATKRRNPWGLYDAHGNVWELCRDFADYSSGVVTNTYTGDQRDPLCASGARRVFRGGSWLNSAENCRAAARGADGPGVVYSLQGFRVSVSSIR